MNVSVTRLLLATLTMSAAISGCAKQEPTTQANPADQIYFGGPIVTVNDAQPTAEACRWCAR
jgi:hypothetical protein